MARVLVFNGPGQVWQTAQECTARALIRPCLVWATVRAAIFDPSHTSARGYVQEAVGGSSEILHAESESPDTDVRYLYTSRT